MQLREPIKFDSSHQKIGLPTRQPPSLAMATFTGWGKQNDEYLRPSRYLLRARYEVLPPKQCSTFKDDYDVKKQICANDIRGQGTCTVSNS